MQTIVAGIYATKTKKKTRWTGNGWEGEEGGFERDVKVEDGGKFVRNDIKIVHAWKVVEGKAGKVLIGLLQNSRSKL